MREGQIPLFEGACLVSTALADSIKMPDTLSHTDVGDDKLTHHIGLTLIFCSKIAEI